MVLSFGYVKESVPHHLGATAVGIVNLGVMVGPLVQQPVLGAILDHYAAVENITGAYSKAGMTVCMLVLAVWVGSSIVSLMLSRETHANQDSLELGLRRWPLPEQQRHFQDTFSAT